jgi:hypothetical protein
MRPEELLRFHGIELKSYEPGQHCTTCRKCSHQRKKNQIECLSVKITDDDHACWNCHHCGWSGPEKGSTQTAKTADYHVYRNTAGQEVRRKVRNPPDRQPRFWWQHRKGGGWVKGYGQEDKHLLYRIDEVMRAIGEGRPIAVVEGEKDADNLWAIDIPATCSPHGAAEKGKQPKWLRDHSKQLVGADLVVLNDNAGCAHADETCKLSAGVAKRVRRLDLKTDWPEIPQGGDVSDWLAVGGEHTPERLKALIDRAPDCADPETAAGEAESAPDGDAELEHLARMPPLEYGRAREKAAKKFGVGVGILDEAVEAKRRECGVGTPDDSDEKRIPQRDKIIKAVRDAGVKFWRDEDHEAYVTVPRDGHFEQYRVRSTAFRNVVRALYGKSNRSSLDTPGAVSDAAWREVKPTFEAMGFHAQTVRAPDTRIYLDSDGTVWFDLGDPQWLMVHITAKGWRVVDDADVPLIRCDGMRAIKAPIDSGVGVLERYRRLLNIREGPDFILTISFLLASIFPKGPYPVEALHGPDGCGKTTTCKIMRQTVDRNGTNVQAPPRTEQDLILAASNSRIIAPDNCSFLTAEMADAICRVTTGTGLRKRKLYSDDEEAIISVTRPVLLNGIPDLLLRGDLASRAIVLTLATIPDNERRTERAVLAEADEIAPAVLGPLFTGLSTALRRLPRLKLPELPRMADFACLACAAAPAFGWSEEDVLNALRENHAIAASAVVEADRVATAVVKLVEGDGLTRVTEWKGTATELLYRLNAIVGETVQKAKDWPKDATRLSGRLRRQISSLRTMGIEIDLGSREGHSRERIISISCKPPSRGASASAPNPGESPGFTGADTADAKNPALGGHANLSESMRWPGLSARAADNLAREISGQKTGSAGELDDAIRSRLAKAGVPAEAMDAEVEKVTDRIGVLEVKVPPDPVDKDGTPSAIGSSNGADGIPFMVTQSMKRRLRLLGYTDEQIADMRPDEAHKILAGQGGDRPSGDAGWSAEI